MLENISSCPDNSNAVRTFQINKLIKIVQDINKVSNKEKVNEPINYYIAIGYWILHIYEDTIKRIKSVLSQPRKLKTTINVPLNLEVCT